MAALGLRERLPRGAVARLETGTRDPDPRVRAAAVAALVRAAGRTRALVAWRRAAGDLASAVRRRAAELAPELGDPPVSALVALLGDDDVTVVEAAAWAVGEVRPSGRARSRAIGVLARLATGHDDPLAREAAVAALGALGDERGLPAVLAACRDKPAVRRRAVLALAPFTGPEVEAALERALTDRDWQTRQAAEDLRR
jgi:HEAT repeat protein